MDIDEAAWRTKGLGFARDGNRYRFIIPGRSDVCDVLVEGDSIRLFVQRDVAHRALQSLLSQG